MESGEVSNADEDLQVQPLETAVPATTIQVQIAGELAGEALVLTHLPGIFLLVSTTWHRHLLPLSSPPVLPLSAST